MTANKRDKVSELYAGGQNLAAGWDMARVLNPEIPALPSLGIPGLP